MNTIWASSTNMQGNVWGLFQWKQACPMTQEIQYMLGGSVCHNNSGDIQIWNNNCQNDIKSLKINNTTTNNPKEIANTFNDYFLTVTDTVNGNIKKKTTMILGITWILAITWLTLTAHF